MTEGTKNQRKRTLNINYITIQKGTVVITITNNIWRRRRQSGDFDGRQAVTITLDDLVYKYYCTAGCKIYQVYKFIDMYSTILYNTAVYMRYMITIPEAERILGIVGR